MLKPDVLDRADVLTMSESDPSYSELQDQASHLPFSCCTLQLLHSCVSLCSHPEAPSLARSAFTAEEGKQLLREDRSESGVVCCSAGSLQEFGLTRSDEGLTIADKVLGKSVLYRAL